MATLKSEDYRREMKDIVPRSVLTAYRVAGAIDEENKEVLIPEYNDFMRLGRELGLDLKDGAVAFPYRGWTWKWWRWDEQPTGRLGVEHDGRAGTA